MNRFVQKKNFHKNIIYHFAINIFYKNKKSKLIFGDHVTVQNNFLFENGGSVASCMMIHEVGD